MSAEIWILFVLTLVALNGAFVGTFLVLRGMSMLTDAMSHAVLFGIAVAAILSGSLASSLMLLGGTLACLLTAYLAQYLQDHGRVQRDASIGIVFTWLFALGVILISAFAKKVHIDQECVLLGEIVLTPFDTISLFGNELGPKAFWTLIIVLFFNCTLVFLGFKRLVATSFDSVHSDLLLLQPKLWNFLLLLAVSFTSVASFEAVGVILIVSLIVTPSATAYLISRSVLQMLVYSTLFGISSVILGYYLAAQVDASISASCALVSAVIFVMIFFTQLIAQSRKNATTSELLTTQSNK